jgi:hypothetical protein
MDRARFRINLSQRELEVEGSEAFVAGWAERFDELLGGGPGMERDSVGEPAVPMAREDLGPFGQYVQRLPRAATEVDRILAAGWWIQHRAQDDAFATGDASRLLAEHGIRIGNPSQAVRQSLMAKRVFLVQKGRYRVSQQGRHYLDRLIGLTAGI